VDDHDGFEVTENLYRALRRLRQRRVRRLLVDAICINQSDDREKEWQVGHMGSIYREASSVQIWIGGSTSTARSCLTRVLFALGKFALRDYDPRGHTWMMEKLVDDELRIIISDATSLWWERVWVWPHDRLHVDSPNANILHKVVQELALAQKEPDVLSGGMNLPWYMFRRHTHNRLCVLLDNMNEARVGQTYSASRGLGVDILALFSLILNSRSHDPRDKIFGILALLPEVEQRKISVSYEKSCAKVYTEATAARISSYGVLDPLAFVFLDGSDGRYSSSLDHSHRFAELPSWVLDFTCIEDDSNSGLADTWPPSIGASNVDLIGGATTDDYGGQLERDAFRNVATTIISSSPRMCYKAFQNCVKPDCVGREYIKRLDSGLLHLGGLVIDRIVKRLKTPRNFSLRRENWNEEKERHAQYALFATDLRHFLYAQSICRPYTHLANQCSWLMNDLDKDEIKWPDIVDQIPSTLPETNQGIDIVWHTFAVWRTMAEHTVLPRLKPSYDREDLHTTGTFERYFDVATKCTMLFVTSSGFLGITLDRVEEGDRIVLVHGCESPIVLRQVAEDRYTFQGLAYLNGIMQGELDEMITDDHIEHESFVII